ncbi:retinol dehydrogenase 12-like isoform X2 [Protopterus annectens]|uniref:retinol dehydrogenase 12-like isoform X2 n=1 Tax=Protopterus annectens TaxID=7888 RepID=UPI001CF976DD|nr:retinol dehydrogenase 12-like isoform X2 [Protopterus annectens]
MSYRYVTELTTDLITWYAAVVAVTVTSLILLRRWIAGGVCRSKARLDGKTVIITGANTGIGKETARDLAARGARVIFACRDTKRGEDAAAEVRNSTGNGNIIVKKLDLASLASVRQFAKEICETEPHLDILINNAGVLMGSKSQKSQTEDGFEIQFGVNHLGHFLLTNLLLDKLRHSAPSRIVTVSSTAHATGKIQFEDTFLVKNCSSFACYSQSKLANVLFTRELAKRLKGSGVTTYCLHPGVIRTEISRHLFVNSPILRMFLTLVCHFFLKTPAEGAQTTIYCAVAEELQNTSGLYYSDCAPKEPATHAKDDELARKLWDLSAKLVGME